MDEISFTLQEVYCRIIDFVYAEPEEDRTLYRRAVTADTVGFLCFLAACMLIYYPLVIRSLNRSIKCNRSLLLLVPDEVVPSVLALKEALSALVKKLGV